MRAVQSPLSTNAPVLFRRAAIVLPVLLLHVVLLWLLKQGHPERSDSKRAPIAQPMFLRWIESAVTAAPDASPAAPAVPRVVPTPDRNPAPAVMSRPVNPTPLTANSATPSTESAASRPPGVATELAPEVTPANAETPRPLAAPLDLRLPRAATTMPSTRTLASLATRDSRANSERVGVGEKLAEALGSDQRRTEENLGDGRVRLRSGADCVIAEESRAGQLDPMSQTTRPAPRGVKPCK
jgi:hypothetical protein